MKKIIKLIPFLLIPVITPLYVFLDRRIFVEVFGCGCVRPGFEANSLGNYFNANDLRFWVFGILTIIAILIGAFVSRSFRKKASIIIYNLSVISLNIFLFFNIIKSFMWK